MGKTTGFKEFAREAAPCRDAAARLRDFDEIYTPHDEGRLAAQSACVRQDAPIPGKRAAREPGGAP